MKKYVILLSCSLFSCNQNNKSSVVTNVPADTAKVLDVKHDTIQKNINAAAVLPSDSLSVGNTTAEQWKISGFDNPDEFKSFFKEFKLWTADNNIDSITSHINFPLRNCKSADVFKKDYTKYFNSLVKNSVAQQDPDKFFVNYNGAMTGNGEIWFNKLKGKYVVIAINYKAP